MTDENITHGQKIKHTFKYGEQRRALWLNTHSKDEYGRHRSAILYGMNTVIAGDATLRIEPGAVVTPYGTRFFFEQFASSQNPTFNVVDLTPIFERSADFPITVCVYLRFSYPDATIPPAVEDIASFDTQLVGFGFRVVPHDLEGVRPAINLTPRDPILLDRNQNNQNGDYTSSASVDMDKNSVYYKPATGETGDVDKLAEAAALQFGEIPLAYVIFGANPDTGEAPSTLSSPGVDIVKCSNVFSSISNIIGHDVFFGRHGRRVVPLSDAADATALQQGYATSQINDNATPELAAPKYGTGQPVTELISPVSDPTGQKLISDQDKDSWTQSDWSTYRKPNFLRDGDSVVWSLRRLDYIMRLWIDRTGDQALISAIQDGTLETPTSYTVLSITLGSGPAGTDEIFIDGIVDTDWVGQTLTLSQGNGNDAFNPYTVISVNGTTNAIRVAHSGSHVATGQLGSLIVNVITPSLPTHVRPMMTLDGILQHFRGNDRPLDNVLDIVYATGDLVSSVNHVVKSGRPAHLPQTPENVSNTGYGDSHVNAISVLDRGVWHILNDIFGRDFARRAIRKNVTWRSGNSINSGPLGDDAVSMEAALRHDDGPTGRRPVADADADGFTGEENTPTVTGPVTASYLLLDDIYTAVGRVAQRAQSGGSNWLRNPNFFFGLEAGPTNPPLNWLLTGTVSWTRLLISEATELYAAHVEFGASGRLVQVVDFDAVSANENMLTMSMMHWAAAIKIVTGTIRIGVRGLNAGGGEVFTVIRSGLTPSTNIDNYNGLFNLTGTPSTISKLEFFVDSADDAEITIYGASMGPGVPPVSTFYDHDTLSYLSRDGGPQSAMRGNLDMGANDIVNAKDIYANHDVIATHDLLATNDVKAGRDSTADRDVIAAHDVVAFNNVTAAKRGLFSEGASMGDHRVTDVADPVNPTDAVNKRNASVVNVDGTEYTSAQQFKIGNTPTYVNLGNSLSVVVGATTWYFPASTNPDGPVKCGCTCTCTCACTCACACTCTGTRWN